MMGSSSASFVGPKGRPPLRACPADFDVIFIEQGRLGCESWYRASRSTVNRWMDERDAKRLIDARAAYVAHQRSQGAWITRQTRMIEHKEVRKVASRAPVRDRRKVSFTLARHAAQHIRIIRNGGFIVSPASDGEWWVGSLRLSAAQMVDLAVEKGFDRKASLQAEQAEEVER